MPKKDDSKKDDRKRPRHAVSFAFPEENKKINKAPPVKRARSEGPVAEDLTAAAGAGAPLAAAALAAAPAPTEAAATLSVRAPEPTQLPFDHPYTYSPVLSELAAAVPLSHEGRGSAAASSAAGAATAATVPDTLLAHPNAGAAGRKKASTAAAGAGAAGAGAAAAAAAADEELFAELWVEHNKVKILFGEDSGLLKAYLEAQFAGKANYFARTEACRFEGFGHCWSADTGVKGRLEFFFPSDSLAFAELAALVAAFAKSLSASAEVAPLLGQGLKLSDLAKGNSVNIIARTALSPELLQKMMSDFLEATRQLCKDKGVELNDNVTRSSKSGAAGHARRKLYGRFFGAEAAASSSSSSSSSGVAASQLPPGLSCLGMGSY